jgi:23S rRNA (adenine2503-C2)-methyltransferase
MEDLSPLALLGLDRSAVAALVESMGEPAYRTQQLLEAVYRQRAESIEQISTLPQELRLSLAEKGVSIGLPTIEKRFVSQDGTVRYLIALSDGQSVETVWMPEGRQRRWRFGGRRRACARPDGRARASPNVPEPRPLL